ncbi:DNA translocase SpoIIIE [bacterium BMS3Bbin03]|nr:DNA translocase SpoIIIE [bacterium BMS3Bbin03]
MNRKPIRKKSFGNKKKEISGILLLVLGVLIFLSLIFYSVQDWPNGSSPQPVHNLMGLAGAYVAHYLLIYTIGFPIIVLPVLIFFLGLKFLTNRSVSGFFQNSLLVLFYATTLSIAITLPKVTPNGIIDNSHYEWNGDVGYFFASHLIRYFGVIGSLLILFTIIVLPVLYLTDFSFTKIMEFFSNRFSGVFEKWQNSYASRKRNWALRRELKREEKKKRAREKVGYEREITEEEFEESDVTGIQIEEDFTDGSGPVEGRSSRRSQDYGQEAEAEQIELPLDDKLKKMPETELQKAKIQISREEVEEIPADYELPPIDLLDESPPPESRERREELLEMARYLEQKLGEYDVRGKVVQIHPGPVITQFEVEPDSGVKISKFVAIADDLAMVLRARTIRIVAPIPGKSVVGIEIPNRKPAKVSLRSVMESDVFEHSQVRLPLGLGVDITGKVYVADLAKMPHLLVAGTTGSGKSVCLNIIITSLLFKFSPEIVRFVLIDPKRLEFSVYARLLNHHLITLPDLNEDVITIPENAVTILKGMEKEMEHRYRILAKANVRNLGEFNQAIEEGEIHTKLEEKYRHKMPYIIIAVDELSDLMLICGKDIEGPISRLAHMARAVGIHMILATQRPSTDVLTGVIKANFPCRIALRVSSKTDSRVILDTNGADKLLGDGDMLFLPPGQSNPVRLHSAYVSAKEIERVLKFIESQPKFPHWDITVKAAAGIGEGELSGRSLERDELFNEALKLVVRHQQGSISLLQRRLRIGYARAARLIDQMEQVGYVGAFDGSKAREVLITEEDLDNLLD